MEGDPVCPACLSTRNHLTIEFSAEQAAQDFVQAKEYPEINLKLRSHLKRLWKGDTCEIRSCANCGMGFSWPFVSGDDVFYNLAYPTVGYPKMKWEFERTLRALRERDLSSKHMLDVGAGFGFFWTFYASTEPRRATSRR